uniref:Uncharacterized protein n=1 Tax=Romanomermis culicivorax TaxID=13658 RepID=A0A915JF14_ROMCU
MLQFVAYILLLSCEFFTLCETRTECTLAVGRLICKQDPRYHQRVTVEMLDKDTFVDAKMNANGTDMTGNFQIFGCASDPIGPPDPYIKIQTKCNAKKRKTIKTKVMHVFIPEVANFSDIYLD